MERTLLIILGTVAVYAALIVQIAFPTKTTKKIIGTAGVIAILCGLVFYGVCFAEHEDNVILAILKTCQAVCLLFIGENSMDAIAGAPMLQFISVQMMFSALSFLGIFTTAGAAISTFGTSFLQKLRLYFRKRRPVSIIMPLNPKTLELAREMVGTLVVFVDKNPDSSCLDVARELGCLVRSDDNALAGNLEFLQSLGGRRVSRSVSLYALSDDLYANRQYAQNLMKTLSEAKCLKSNFLTIFADEHETENHQIYAHEQHNYNNIFCTSQEQLAARLLIRNAPPWKTISFDKDAKATEDFHALLVGGGKVGQAVLKQLVMNSQFAGSNFALTVFDPQFDERSGQLRFENPALFQRYNIKPYPHDGRSYQMYQFLHENVQILKYVVVCTGNDATNRDIAKQLAHYFQTCNCTLPVHICSSRGLQRITASREEHWDVYSHKTLNDYDAMRINQMYCGNTRSPIENWADTDSHTRASSIAMADFMPALLEIAGLSIDTLPAYDWCSPVQLENLAITEHERWCAAMICRGWRAMTEEEFAERCHIYREELSRKPHPRYRINRDVSKRLHNCLVPWEELDALSVAENAVTGGSIDYKQMDRDLIMTLPALMRGDFH